MVVMRLRCLYKTKHQVWSLLLLRISSRTELFLNIRRTELGLSLYNTNRDDHSFHCGDYLKKNYGGGGHEGAAGAQITETQFIKILKTKTL